MATVYATADAAGGGDGTFGLPFTMAEAVVHVNNLGVMTEDEVIRIIGDPEITAELNITQTGTAADRVIWEGRNAGDTADATVALTRTVGGGPVWNMDDADFHVFRNITVTPNTTGGTGDGWNLDAASDNILFYKCRATGGDIGWNIASGSSSINFVKCTADNNNDEGIKFVDLGDGQLVDCVLRNNGSYGMFGGQTVLRSLVYENGHDGISDFTGTCVASSFYLNSGEPVKNVFVGAAYEDNRFQFSASDGAVHYFAHEAGGVNDVEAQSNATTVGGSWDEGSGTPSKATITENSVCDIRFTWRLTDYFVFV